ncbi:transporter substrate-binding domain-containing protein [Pelagibaculum spongiae]|uniref:Arginine ABC transporter substrate-binding protein n=1 Tax=Pelagibaculum spongiae TaxID=2080658 RepID=A0A2V1GTD9_9GAMM|nr:transporter substrate-binding domain-containing protein [Pelagibaculum spongiae]PVZ68868.1 arginine ABC transporter substrate-binding protein [Pelagibaculum spongiae]
MKFSTNKNLSTNTISTKKIISSVALAIGLSLTVSQSVGAADNIRFGTEPTYPPFEFLDDNNQMTGFDIELAKAICADIQANCEFKNQAFDSLIPGLKFKRFDAVISGMDITPARLEHVDFSAPYYENSAVFITAKAKNLKNIADLSGKVIGTQNGSTHQAYMINKLESNGVKIRTYDSYLNALLDLKNGRTAAVFADTAVAREWLAKPSNVDFVITGAEIKDPDYFGIGMGIAVRKNDGLKAKFDASLAKLKTNGVYQKLFTKYFQAK